jgi:hypothetical protein
MKVNLDINHSYLWVVNMAPRFYPHKFQVIPEKGSPSDRAALLSERARGSWWPHVAETQVDSSKKNGDNIGIGKSPLLP